MTACRLAVCCACIAFSLLLQTTRPHYLSVMSLGRSACVQMCGCRNTRQHRVFAYAARTHARARAHTHTHTHARAHTNTLGGMRVHTMRFRLLCTDNFCQRAHTEHSTRGHSSLMRIFRRIHVYVCQCVPCSSLMQTEHPIIFLMILLTIHLSSCPP